MVKYELYIFGGSLGEIASDKSKKQKFFSGVGWGRLWGTYDTKEKAQKRGRDYVSSFSGGHRNYYRPKFRVVKVTKRR